jgi:hypothetical protein
MEESADLTDFAHWSFFRICDLVTGYLLPARPQLPANSRRQPEPSRRQPVCILDIEAYFEFGSEIRDLSRRALPV